MGKPRKGRRSTKSPVDSGGVKPDPVGREARRLFDSLSPKLARRLGLLFDESHSYSPETRKLIDNARVLFDSVDPRLRAKLRQLAAERLDLRRRLRECEQEIQQLTSLQLTAELLSGYYQGLYHREEVLARLALDLDAQLTAKK